MSAEILYLNKDSEPIPIRIKPNTRINSNIYWSFTEVSITENVDSDSLHNFFSSSFNGSNHYTGDEGFVFDNKELILSSLFLSVPEENFDGKELLKELLLLPAITGLPYLLKKEKFHPTSSTDFRYLSYDCNYLICISKNLIDTDNCSRISIHERLDLIFHDKNHIADLY